MSQYKKKQAQPARPVHKPVAAATAHIASAPAQAKPTSPSAPLRSMDQERAEFALRKIEATLQCEHKMQAEVRRYLNNLPALIRINGLGQALAFFRMKDAGSGHRHIYNMVGAWLCEANSAGRVFHENPDVLTAITKSDMQHYMAAQNESLALLEWLKKFAIALLPKE